MEHKKEAGKAAETFSRPENYADYCAALHRGEENALLMYAVRSWLFALQEKLEQGTSELLVTGLCLPETTGLQQDAFSGLLAGCQRALETILVQPREKIVRENTMLPVHKVRELDSNSISWLERRPGRTMREKVRNSRSIMAVDRRMSMDTDENRLLKLFVCRSREIALLKLEGLDPAVDTTAEHRFLRTAAKMKALPGMEEVRMWNSPRPNQVLISDRQYRQIWKAWIALNELDLQTKRDAESLSEHIATILWAQFLVDLRSLFRLPQLPLQFDWRTGTLDLAISPGYLEGVDDTGEVLTLRRTPGRVSVTYQGQTAELSVMEQTVLLRLRGGKAPQQKTMQLTAGTLLQPVRALWEMMGLPDIPAAPAAVPEAPEAVIDLFAPQPFFFRGTMRRLKEPLFGQELRAGQAAFCMPCADARALWLGTDNALFSIGSAVRNANAEQLRILTGSLKRKLNARTLTCLVPDNHSEFELKPLRTVLHLDYPNLKELPRSIAAVFAGMRSEQWRKNFREGDYALVVDLCGTQCSMTILRGTYAVKDWDGLVWERHLRMRKELPETCRQALHGLYRKLEERGMQDPEELARVLGVEGLLALCRKTALWQDDDSWTWPSPENIRLDVTPCVEGFLQEFGQKQKIGKEQVHVILLSSCLCCGGGMQQTSESRNGLIGGYRYYESCQQAHPEPLWYDYLPRLAIRRLTDSFELVDPARARVEPGRRERMQIEVKGQFILPGGKADYHFGLIQGSGTSDVRYEAVLKHNAFPLRNDVACKLQLFYTYGAEEAYELFFCPADPAQAPFRAVKAQWKRQNGVDVSALPCPPFARTGWQDVDAQKMQDAIQTLKFVVQEAKSPRQTCTLTRPLKAEDWVGDQVIVTAASGDGAEMQAIELQKRDFDAPKETRQEITRISCTLLRLENKESVSLRLRNGPGSRPWIENDKGRMRTVQENQEKRKVVLFESNFVPGTFREDLEWVTVELDSSRGEQDKWLPEWTVYWAQNILPGKAIPDGAGALPLLRAKNIRAGNRRTFYAEQRLKLAGLYNVLANDRKLSDPECPGELRDIAKKALPALTEACRQYTCAADTLTVHRKTFSALCLLAPSMGEVCYPFLLKQIRAKQNMRSIVSVSSALGMALGDLTVPEQKELLEECLKLYEDVALRILACAVWNSENFVRNADPQMLLQWLCKATRLLEMIYLPTEQNAGWNQSHAVRYFEFILGVFRLRGVPGQSEAVLRALSLEDPTIRLLLECVRAARTQPEKSDLNRTRIRFQNASGTSHRDVPDLLYALLKYITGENDDEIIIVGIDEAEEDEEPDS